MELKEEVNHISAITIFINITGITCPQLLNTRSALATIRQLSL